MNSQKIKGIVMLSLFLSGCASVSTRLIRDEKGNIIPESIASLQKVKLGGMDQWILIRGANVSNPILLWLHGGPGAAQMPVAHHFNGDLEKEFIVVHWDQRGAGKSNPKDFDEQTMTLEQFITDAHELTQYLKKRFHKEKIYLLGHSWGTLFGILLVQKYPQDYYAYIGVSQVVNGAAASKIAHKWLVQQIKKRGKTKDLRKLEKLGPPPFTDHEKYVKFAKMVDSYGGGMDVGFLKLAWIALRAPEYSLTDYPKWLRGASRGSGPMWEETSSFDVFKEVPELQVPAYFFSGRNDYNTPLQLVRRYFEMLNAPKGKQLIIFENSAHTPFMKEPEKFYREMVRVKEETYNPKKTEKK
jgi:pimeloyl-ACP methyl ester carboxylesterase